MTTDIVSRAAALEGFWRPGMRYLLPEFHNEPTEDWGRAVYGRIEEFGHTFHDTICDDYEWDRYGDLPAGAVPDLTDGPTVGAMLEAHNFPRYEFMYEDGVYCCTLLRVGYHVSQRSGVGPTKREALAMACCALAVARGSWTD